MNNSLFIITITLLLPFLATAQRADLKFQKKAAEKVWKVYPDLFNPQREIRTRSATSIRL